MKRGLIGVNWWPVQTQELPGILKPLQTFPASNLPTIGAHQDPKDLTTP